VGGVQIVPDPLYGIMLKVVSEDGMSQVFAAVAMYVVPQLMYRSPYNSERAAK